MKAPLDFTKHIRVEALTLDGDTLIDCSVKFKDQCMLTNFIKIALLDCGSCHVFLYQSGDMVEDFVMSY